MAVKEKSVATKPSEIDFVEDGMIVRLVCHNPIKLFFKPARLYTFVVSYEKELAKLAEERQASFNKFFAKKFKFVMMARNNVKLILDPPIYGHPDLVLPKDLFIKAIKDMFEP